MKIQDSKFKIQNSAEVSVRVKRASKCGSCPGVRRADTMARQFAAAGGRGAILGALVHNERLMSELEGLGLKTIDSLDLADGPTVLFSAHGVPPSTHVRARELKLDVLDATCSCVADIHREVVRALADGSHLVFVGDADHREVVGYTHDLTPNAFHIVSVMDDVRAVDWAAFPRINVIYQTTVDAGDFEDLIQYIEERNPRTVRADTVCHATRENQDAARELAVDPEVEVVLVIGGRRSANTRHLWEIARKSKPSYLIQGVEDICLEWLGGASCVGLTAGTSTPESAIGEVEAFLERIEAPMDG